MPDHYRDLRAGLSGLLIQQNRRLRLTANVAGLLCDLDEVERTINLEQRIAALADQLLEPEVLNGESPDLTGYPQPADRPGVYRDQLQEAMRRASEEPPLAPPQPQQMPNGMGTWDGRSLTPPQWGEYDRNLDPTRGRGERG